ncbi:hypothetical protein GE061_012692 [Apolygus lucorum]|uniref:J domain-containing protein n=1 Tax=Apolygus lucorum TaxID=248454 RepID=A0A6A4JCM8_APOLU|nr:hypothetical protein GE061_012692 [Apolygus lucorum]
MDKDALMENDLYELFDLTPSCSVQDIKKAYRKKALKCHPDKNPDNPNAVKLFLELSTALEILIDETLRAKYDKLLTGRQAAKIRHDALDSKRRKLKEDLEARERMGGSTISRDKSSKTAEEKLKAEVEKLRKEGSRQLLEEMQKVKEQIRAEMFARHSDLEEDGSAYRLKVKWKSDKTDDSNGGYDSENLHKIFSKYGNISCIVVSQKKKGSALLEFETKSSAVKAFQLEKGYGNNPLTLSWVNEAIDLKSSDSSSGPAKRCTPLNQCGVGSQGGLFPSFLAKSSVPTAKYNSHQSPGNADEDFEAMVFAKMREAQEKKESAT